METTGLCGCGCGGKTRIATKTSDRAKGRIKGQPYRYIRGHNTRLSGVPYLEQDCGYETPCWVWQRSNDGHGYGAAVRGKKVVKAHRYYWEEANGTVPEGLQLDHLCRVRMCVNPDHLEPVTHAENGRRGAATILTAAQVKEIRARIASGPYGTQKRIAGEYG